MNSKHVKSLILNYEIDDILFEDNINNNFYHTITGICTSIFELLNYYDNDSNKELLNNLLYILENIINNTNELDKLKFLDTSTKKLISDIHTFISKEVFNDISNIVDILNTLNKNIKSKKKDELSYSRIKVIEELIYNDRDLKRIKTLIISNNKILDIKDSMGENVFYKVLKKYNDLIDNNDIDYLYEVIMLFIYSGYNKDIVSNKDYYLTALSNTNKDHVSSVIDRIEGRKIELSKLEEKYNVKLMYPKDIEEEMYSYNYNSNNIVDYRNQLSLT